MLCNEHKSTQEYLKRRMLSVMESVNRVCEEACEGHEWVSELASMQEEVLVDLDYELDVPCVVHAVVLSAFAAGHMTARA